MRVTANTIWIKIGLASFVCHVPCSVCLFLFLLLTHLWQNEVCTAPLDSLVRASEIEGTGIGGTHDKCLLHEWCKTLYPHLNDIGNRFWFDFVLIPLRATASPTDSLFNSINRKQIESLWFACGRFSLVHTRTQTHRHRYTHLIHMHGFCIWRSVRICVARLRQNAKSPRTYTHTQARHPDYTVHIHTQVL